MKAEEYNIRKQRLGTFTYKHISDLVLYLQHSRGFRGDDLDGKFGKKTLVELERAISEIDNPADPADVSGPYDGWVWPVRACNGERPVISSRFSKNGSGPNRSRRNHWGVDIMLDRHDDDGGPQERYASGPYKGLRRPQHPVYTPTKYWPSGQDCLSVGPAIVCSVKDGSHGLNILLDHSAVPGGGPMVATWYQHLHETMVDIGDFVLAGDTIGIVGCSGTDINHLHFEWRDCSMGRGRAATVVNPEPYISQFALAGEVSV